MLQEVSTYGTVIFVRQRQRSAQRRMAEPERCCPPPPVLHSHAEVQTQFAGITSSPTPDYVEPTKRSTVDTVETHERISLWTRDIKKISYNQLRNVHNIQYIIR